VKTVKIAIVIVALGAAVVIAWVTMRGGEDATRAKAEETRTPWLCAACKQGFYLTSSEVEKQLAEGPPPLACSHCKARQASVAMVCEKCGTFYFQAGMEGSSGKCPKCFPDAAPPTDFADLERAPPELQPTEEELYEENEQGVKVRKKPLVGG
jgi:ribosomal protein L40E